MDGDARARADANGQNKRQTQRNQRKIKNIKQPMQKQTRGNAREQARNIKKQMCATDLTPHGMIATEVAAHIIKHRLAWLNYPTSLEWICRKTPTEKRPKREKVRALQIVTQVICKFTATPKQAWH